MTSETAPFLKVLIVDDERSFGDMLVTMLRRSERYRADVVTSAQEALNRLMAQPGDYPLVLCDVKMPRMNGLEFVSAAKQAGLASTIIMMSAFGTVDLAIEAIRCGAYDYISKPFKRDELILTLRKATERLRLEARVAELETQLGRLSAIENSPRPLLGNSESMRRLKVMIAKVAGFDTTVLITGESGTGKELVARAIHGTGSRASASFVAVNCGAIPETLLESELFGHVRGAFTDAKSDKIGLFEEASGGTLLLDEVGELPAQLQVALLRVLQEGEIRPVGATRSTRVDVRIVAATHRNLSEAVAEGRFREDLYYRLNVLQLETPPLRERTEDIQLLAEHVLVSVSRRMGLPTPTLSPEAFKTLLGYPWPGNVRELENAIERAIVLCEDNRIEASDLPLSFKTSASPVQVTLSSENLSIKKAHSYVERELIKRALKQTESNRTKAARLLEISHRSLLYKLKDYGLQDF